MLRASKILSCQGLDQVVMLVIGSTATRAGLANKGCLASSPKAMAAHEVHTIRFLHFPFGFDLARCLARARDRGMSLAGCGLEVTSGNRGRLEAVVSRTLLRHSREGAYGRLPTSAFGVHNGDCGGIVVAPEVENVRGRGMSTAAKSEVPPSKAARWHAGARALLARFLGVSDDCETCGVPRAQVSSTPSPERLACRIVSCERLT